MDIDVEIDKFESLVYDQANDLDIEPVLITDIAFLACKGQIAEENLFKQYLKTLVYHSEKKARIESKSRDHSIAFWGNESLQPLTQEDMQELVTAGDLMLVLKALEELKIKRPVNGAHMDGLYNVRKDFDDIKERFNAESVTEVINRDWLKRFESLIRQYERIAEEYEKIKYVDVFL